MLRMKSRLGKKSAMAPVKKKKKQVIPKKCFHCESKTEAGEGVKRCYVCRNRLIRQTEVDLRHESAEFRFIFTEILHGPAKQKEYRFVDRDFLPLKKSLGGSTNIRRRVTTWQRLQFFLPDDIDVENLMLFKNASPSDIQQGSIGNCGLMAVVSVLANRPELLGNIFNTQRVSSCGSYKINLYSKSKGSTEWQLTPTIIDDLIPCTEDKPALSKVIGLQIWVPLLEKAVAKLCGSFRGLYRISPSDAFGYLLGRKCTGVTWKASEVNAEILWPRLYALRKYLLVAAAKADVRLKSNKGHGFALLGLFEVGNRKLVKLRNPHGRTSKAMLGSLSPDSAIWSELRLEAAEELTICTSTLEYQDGIFWMLFGEFVKYFYHVTACDRTNGS